MDDLEVLDVYWERACQRCCERGHHLPGLHGSCVRSVKIWGEFVGVSITTGCSDGAMFAVWGAVLVTERPWQGLVAGHHCFGVGSCWGGDWVGNLAF